MSVRCRSSVGTSGSSLLSKRLRQGLKDLLKERYLSLLILGHRVILIKTAIGLATLGNFHKFRIISDQVTIILFKNQFLLNQQEMINYCPKLKW